MLNSRSRSRHWRSNSPWSSISCSCHLSPVTHHRRLSSACISGMSYQFSDASITPKRAMNALKKRTMLRQMVRGEVTNVVDSNSEITVYMKYIVFRPCFRDCTEHRLVTWWLATNYTGSSSRLSGVALQLSCSVLGAGKAK